jgi:hypothetical protein
VFFDTGHVVSNSPILRISEKPQKNLPDEARVSLNEALEGGAEFFILAVLDYQNQPRSGNAVLKPRNISLRLFKTDPCRFLVSQEYSPEAVFSESVLREGRITEKDELVNAMGAARGIASHIKG